MFFRLFLHLLRCNLPKFRNSYKLWNDLILKNIGKDRDIFPNFKQQDHDSLFLYHISVSSVFILFGKKFSNVEMGINNKTTFY